MVPCSQAVFIIALIFFTSPINVFISSALTEEDFENMSQGELDYGIEKGLEEFNKFSESNQDTRNRITRKLVKKTMPFSITTGHDERRLIPVYSSISHKRCSCELDFKPLDLGHGYFPRYLQSGECKPDSCDKHYRCIEKKYKVKVLKTKSFEDSADISGKTFLPKILRDAFVSEVITVSVACQCVIDY